MANTQENFNWQAYLSANPDIAGSSYGNKSGAWEHYSNYGAREGRAASFDINPNKINADQTNNQANFNYVQYLKDNPDVAGSSFGNPNGAWEHYSKWGGPIEGRAASFDLGSKNTLPSEDKLKTDPETGLQYSTTPGHVGYVASVSDENGDTTKQWMPSAFDFTGAKYNESNKTYTMPSGEKVGYDFGSNSISSYDPVYDKASNVSYGSNFQVYAPTSGQRTANFQGLNLDKSVVNQGEFLVDPNTKQYYKDSSGNPIPVYHERSSGGFGDWLTENGWMIPAAMATAGAGMYALGAEAAVGAGGAGAIDSTAVALGGSGGGGAFVPAAGSGASFGVGAAGGGILTPGADAVLNAPTNLANLTPPGTGTFGSITPPLTGSGAVPGAGALTSGAIGEGTLTGALPAGVMVGDGTLGTTIGQTYMAAAPGQFAVDAFGSAIPTGTAGIAGTVPSGLSLADIATNAKRLQSIAKLLGGSGSNITGKSAPTAGQWAQQAGQNFAQATPEQFGGLYKMNKDPFTFNNPLANALAANKPTGLDVSGTSGQALNTQNQTANLLRMFG
jgi:hypothetical protein